MNALRQLVGGWRVTANDPHGGNESYKAGLEDAADELSAELPKWERVIEAAKRYGTHGTPENATELWAAIEAVEVRHD